MTPPRYSTDLTDDRGAPLVPLTPEPARTGRPRADLREVANGVRHPVRTGCQWRLLPRCFPPWGTAHAWYRRWRADGTPGAVHDALRGPCRVQAGRDASPAGPAVGRQSVGAAGRGGEGGFDAGRKVAGRKRHRWVDGPGLLLAVLVTRAGTHDARAAGELPHRRRWDEGRPRLRVAYADPMYRADCLRGEVSDLAPSVPRVASRPPGSVGFVRPPRRRVAERAFAWPGRSRRLSKGCGRQVASSAAMVKPSVVHRMLRRLAPVRRKRSERFRHKKAK